MTQPLSTKLYYCETLNPRKACAVAKHLASPVEFVRVDLATDEHKSPEHLRRNPNGKVPVLEHGGRFIWESLAIMTWLAQQAHSPLWPTDPGEQVEVLRWTAWDAFHWLPATGTFYFEHYVKPALGMGEPNEQSVAAATPEFHGAARILDAHLQGRRFLLGERLTVADFCLAASLPYAEQIRPLAAAPLSRARRLSWTRDMTFMVGTGLLGGIGTHPFA